jgi:hypothetical protein
MGNTGRANGNKSCDRLFYTHAFSFCVTPWLVVLVKSGFMIDVCSWSAYWLFWRGFCCFLSSIHSAQSATSFHSSCSSVSACDSIFRHHAAWAPLVICKSGTIADTSTYLYRFVTANSYRRNMTHLEDTDLKTGNVDSRVISARKGKQPRVSYKNFIATITAQPESPQVQLIYWYICQLQLGWHPVAVHIYT